MLEDFIRAYIEGALSAETDNSTESGGKPLDKNYDESDFAEESMEKIRADCTKFYEEFSHMFDQLNVMSKYSDDERAGHDFWLTRNRHGAGYWDGDWSEPADKILTDAAHAFGECDIYVGDDGKLYVS